MMGLPKIHTWRLPSRNWCIFWSVIGSFAGGIAYDRYEKKQIIARYKAEVAHLANETLQPLQMPRKLNIYMGAPPGDTIHIAREHFNEYIKPVLNSAAVDFELIEGRMQGDIRHRVAQAIRDKRAGKDGLTDLQRATMEKLQRSAEAGDIVLGRHSYKEYIRGKHEGLLGPLEEPEAITAIMNPRMPGDPITEAAPESDDHQSAASDHSGDARPDDKVPGMTLPTVDTEQATPTTAAAEKTEDEIKAEIDAIKAKIPSSPPSYILPPAYASATLLATGDSTRDGSRRVAESTDFTFVPMQHLLGFLNTPWRIYRFLHRRTLAEEMCSATAAAVLATQVRPFERERDLALGRDEEMDWPKKNRMKEEGVWVEEIAVDERVTATLRVYVYQKPESQSDSDMGADQ